MHFDSFVSFVIRPHERISASLYWLFVNGDCSRTLCANIGSLRPIVPRVIESRTQQRRQSRLQQLPLVFLVVKRVIGRLAWTRLRYRGVVANARGAIRDRRNRCYVVAATLIVAPSFVFPGLTWVSSLARTQEEHAVSIARHVAHPVHRVERIERFGSFGVIIVTITRTRALMWAYKQYAEQSFASWSRWYSRKRNFLKCDIMKCSW